jgi:peptide chain release factor 2
VVKAAAQIKLEELESRMSELDKDMQSPDFWADPARAGELSKEAAKLKDRIEPWLKLKQSVADLTDLLGMGDNTLSADIERELSESEELFESTKSDLLYSGPYDDSGAILSIHAGAGGTDAQDWTQMLYRMYVRWAESGGFKTTELEQSAGEEAGLKSVTFVVEGSMAYGKLRGEHGVHRLVRLSPFNADNLRQTSFAKVEVLPKIDSPEAAEIDEKDLKIDVYRAGGHGGQSVNTTDSAVRITHLPTGISVAIQNERSQLQNKETALTILRSRLVQLQLEQHHEKLADIKGPNQSAEWGNQIRSYVLHPYSMVKDLRTRFETSDVDSVLGGDLDAFMQAFAEHSIE